MKTRTFSKKLELNKKTISHLETKEMRIVQGGVKTVRPTICPIYSCERTCTV